MKSRYSVNAAYIACLLNDADEPPELTKYIFLIFWVSYAVNPTKTKTPIIEITKYVFSEPIKILTTEAMIIPNKPIMQKEPNFVKSFFVV